MRARLILIGLFATVSALAALPPGVTSKQIEKSVTLYERPAPQLPLPSFWDGFFSLFQMRKDTKAAFPFARSVALLVGIGNYKYINPTLPFISKDARKMLEYLMAEGGFDAVYVMDEQATPQLVDSYMSKNLMRVGREDRFLFYFSGHGSELDKRIPFLQFQDARPDEWDQAHVLRVDQFQVWSSAINAKHELFIYDACFAGLVAGVPKNSTDQTRASIAELSGNGSRMVVTAGTGEQRSWIEQVSSEQQFSIFTEALIQALRAGAADDRNRGFFTIEQAVANAFPRMAEMTRKLGPGHEMKPIQLAIDARLTGTFVFLNPRADKPRFPLGDATSMGIAIAKGDDPDIDRQIELAFWTSIVELHDVNLYQEYLKRYPQGAFAPVAKTLLVKYQPAVPSELDKANLAELMRLAEQGVREAMTQLGKAYESGSQGAQQDLKKAITYYSQAADQGDGAAAYRLGEVYRLGRAGVPVDSREAARWYQRGADLNYPAALSRLGFWYQSGLGGLDKDQPKSVDLYKRAADLGDSLGIANLGFMYMNGLGGLAKDQRKAVELFQKAADLGDALGMANLGVMYEDAKGGLSKDERKAVELFQKAADLGEANGMANLGFMYMNGLGGLAKDQRKAVELFQKAADLGNALGMVSLGALYQHGKAGLAKNERKAAELYRKAADLGNALGMANLGFMYLYGLGGLAGDERKAVELFAKAAGLGDPVAKAYLGRGYELGRGGLPVDLPRAIALYREAARMGDDYAARQLRRLGRPL